MQKMLDRIFDTDFKSGGWGRNKNAKSILFPLLESLLCSSIKLLREEDEVETEDSMDHILQEEDDVIINSDLVYFLWDGWPYGWQVLQKNTVIL